MPYNPAQKLVFLVELEIDGVMVDITQRTRAVSKARISHGRSPGAIQPETATLNVAIGNADGFLTEGNPLSPWYPHVGRGTQIRLSLLDILPSPAARFDGRIMSLVANYPGGQDSTVRVTAFGRWGQLGIGDDPLDPALHRTILTDNPVQYWRIDDPAGSTSAASSLPGGGQSLAALLDVGWRQLDSPPGGGGPGMAARMNEGVLTGQPAQSPPWALEWSLLRPADGSLDLQSVITIRYKLDGATQELSASTALDTAVSERDWYHYMVTAEQIGGNYELRFYRNGIAQGVVPGHSGAGTLGQLASFDFGNNAASDYSLGYVAVYDHLSVDFGAHSGALQGWAGELAHDRISRLCTEAGLVADIVGTSSVTMGPQQADTLPALLQECETADQGMLSDGSESADITYITLAELYNRTADLAITQGALAKDLPTTWDYRHARNFITSSRPSGSSATVEDAAHIARVGGRLKSSPIVNVDTDEQLPPDAGWRLRLGTTTEPRYPGVPINMRDTHAAGLAQAVLALTEGYRLTVSPAALPSAHPPGGIDGLTIGWEEELDAYEWVWTPNLLPYSPYIVGTAGDGSTPGSWSQTGPATALSAELASGGTSLLVYSDGPLFTADPDALTDSPMSIVVGGEIMHVSEIASAVTDTFTRVVVDSWGTSDSGQVWTVNVASAHDVTGTVGTQLLGGAGTTRRATVVVGGADQLVRVTVTIPVLATGAGLAAGLAQRLTDLNNYYLAEAVAQTDATVTLQLRSNVGGTLSPLANVTLSGVTHTAGAAYTILAEVVGTTVRARAWPTTGSDPGVWMLSVTDSSLTSGTSAGCHGMRLASNTNVDPVISYDDFGVLNPQRFTVSRTLPKLHAAASIVAVHNPLVAAL